METSMGMRGFFGLFDPQAIDWPGMLIYNLNRTLGIAMGEKVTSFGHFFKSHRIRQGITLREFCLKHDLDPGQISKLERDLISPPQSDEILRRYAAALGLKKSSEEDRVFFDLAAAAAGRIPSDIMNDEKLVEKLPIFFRTIRNQPSEEKLEALLKKIREA